MGRQLALRRWHDDGQNVRLYVDGKQVGSGTPATGSIGYGLPTGNNDLFLGHYDGCQGFDFVGSIDEPTVWNQALSASQISGGYALLNALHGWVSRLPSFPMT